MSIEIRPASAAEIGGLGPIERAAGAMFPAGRLPDPEAVTPIAQLQACHVDGGLLVAGSVGSVVGFAASRRVDTDWHLQEVAVHPDHGAQGIGRALVLESVEQARTRGHRAVTLTTFEDLPWNAPFYRKVGFVVLTRNAPAYLLACLQEEVAAGLEQRVAMELRLR